MNTTHVTHGDIDNAKLCNDLYKRAYYNTNFKLGAEVVANLSMTAAMEGVRSLCTCVMRSTSSRFSSMVDDCRDGRSEVLMHLWHEELSRRRGLRNSS